MAPFRPSLHPRFSLCRLLGQDRKTRGRRSRGIHRAIEKPRAEQPSMQPRPKSRARGDAGPTERRHPQPEQAIGAASTSRPTCWSFPALQRPARAVPDDARGACSAGHPPSPTTNATGGRNDEGKQQFDSPSSAIWRFHGFMHLIGYDTKTRRRRGDGNSRAGDLAQTRHSRFTMADRDADGLEMADSRADPRQSRATRAKPAGPWCRRGAKVLGVRPTTNWLIRAIRRCFRMGSRGRSATTCRFRAGWPKHAGRKVGFFGPHRAVPCCATSFGLLETAPAHFHSPNLATLLPSSFYAVFPLLVPPSIPFSIYFYSAILLLSIITALRPF